jgi:hypothetical protein
MHIELGVIEIKIGKNDMQEGLGLVQPVLQRFDILRCGVAASIRGLIVGTF